MSQKPRERNFWDTRQVQQYDMKYRSRIRTKRGMTLSNGDSEDISVIKVKNEMWLKSNRVFPCGLSNGNTWRNAYCSANTTKTVTTTQLRQPMRMCELWCYFKLASKMKCCPGDDVFMVFFAGLHMECALKLRKTRNGEARYLRSQLWNIS